MKNRPLIVVFAALALAALGMVFAASKMPPHRKLQLGNLLEQLPSLPARYMV